MATLRQLKPNTIVTLSEIDRGEYTAQSGIIIQKTKDKKVIALVASKINDIRSTRFILDPTELSLGGNVSDKIKLYAEKDIKDYELYQAKERWTKDDKKAYCKYFSLLLTLIRNHDEITAVEEVINGAYITVYYINIFFKGEKIGRVSRKWCFAQGKEAREAVEYLQRKLFSVKAMYEPPQKEFPFVWTDEMKIGRK